MLQNFKCLHDEVTAATAPRLSWKDNFVQKDDPNLFAVQTYQTLIGLKLSLAVTDEAVIGSHCFLLFILSCLAHVN